MCSSDLVENIFKDINSDFDTVSQAIRTYFGNHSPLSNPDTYNELESVIGTIQYDQHFNNTYDTISDLTNLNRDRELIDELYQEVVSIIDSAYGRL